MSTKTLFKNIHNRFIHNNQKTWKVRCPSIEELINKGIFIQWVLFSKKDPRSRIGESQKYANKRHWTQKKSA